MPTWRKILAQFRDPLIYLLLAAVAISLLAWVLGCGHGWPVDAIVISVVVLLNAVLGYVQEARAESAVAALQEVTAVTSAVLRDGRTEMGSIAGMLEATEEEPTSLQSEVGRIGRMLGIAVIIIAVVVVTVFLISDVRTAADAVTILLLGVSLAVAVVPERLPAILSVVLAVVCNE